MKGESILELIKNEDRDLSVEKMRLDMFSSLMRSVEKAGGNKEKIASDIINGMTVIELIDLLAHNNIRFFYEPPKRENFSGETYR